MRTIAIALLIVACVALAACDSSVNVNATANVGARYSNVRITVKELWVNESASASVDDTSWQKFPLSTPVTLDLVSLDDGSLNALATQLKLSPGEYHQMRVFLADRSEPLTSSAQSAGATYNNEVTFFDAGNVQRTLPLELANPAQGIGIQTDLTVQAADAAILAALATNTNAPSSALASPDLTATPTTTVTTTPTTPTTASPDTTVPTTTTPTTTTPATSTPASSTPATSTPTTTTPTSGTATPTTPSPGTTTPTTPTPTNGLASPSSPGSAVVTANGLLVFDAARDLTAFVFSDQPGFLLNPTLSAYDEKKAGTIQGQLNLSQIMVNSGTGRPDVEVTAEMLSADATRRVEVSSAPVASNGTFILYPLPLDNSKTTTTYDLVIHGPSIQTVVIRDVPVTKGAPANAAAVALGTLTLAPSSSYAANLATGTPVSPRGARIGFYQTLPDDNAPFLIDQKPVDPLSGQLATNANLSSAAAIVYATYGASVAYLAAAPQEGASQYSVAALSPFFGDGAFSNTRLTPPANPATDTATITVPDIAVPSTAAAGTISAQVSTSVPGTYDKGALLVTHDGAVIAAVPLDEALAGSAASGTVTLQGIPASSASGFDRGLYFLDAWVWSSSNPANTFSRQPVAAPVDLRSAVTANATVMIN